MKICIPYFVEGPIFDSQDSQTALRIADMLKDVTLIDMNSSPNWWPDIESLKSDYKIQHVTEATHNPLKYDLLIDIGGSASPSLRRELAATVAVFLTGSLLFDELQSIQTMSPKIRHSTHDADEIWAWDIINSSTDIPILSALFKTPIKLVPFIWTPRIISAILKQGPQRHRTASITRRFSVIEDGTDNKSSPVFPLIALNSVDQPSNRIERCFVFDRIGTKKSRYFKENIIDNLTFKDAIIFQDTVTANSIYQTATNTTLISHTRFSPLNLTLLNTLWMGMPFVHNSPILRDSGFTANYYPNNSVQGLINALKSQQTQEQTQEILQAQWSPEKQAAKWSEIIHKGPSHINNSRMDENTIVYPPPPSLDGPAQLITRDPVFISYATEQQLPSIHLSLESISRMRRVQPEIEYVLYTPPATSIDALTTLKTAYDWIELRTTDPTFKQPTAWILNKTVQQFNNRIVIYSDANVQWLKPCPDLMNSAIEHGACSLTGGDVIIIAFIGNSPKLPSPLKIFSFLPAQNYICEESVRRTFLQSKPIYVHRTNHLINREPLLKTGDIWMVNLDRRTDRWASWAKLYPELAKVTQRFSAIDGKALALTKAIERLFLNNDFKWKKSVIGCALSHIMLWQQLCCEGPEVDSYVILEDDMRFIDQQNGQTLLNDALVSMPLDTELAYFGGVLPNNRLIYSQCIEPVNNVWSVIKPNNAYSRELLPIFHHCAYSYYITKSGASKLLDMILDGLNGCSTSIDHILGHPYSGITKYVMTTPIIGCSEDNNPKYVNTEFDTMMRTVEYDSDIWNNTEVFTPKASGQASEQVQELASIYCATYDVLCQVASSIETCTLLSPVSYCNMLMRKNRERECMAIQQHMALTRINGYAEREFDIIMPKQINEIAALGIMPSTSTTHLRYSKFCVVENMAEIKETLEAGCVPIYIRTAGDEKLWGIMSKCMKMVELSDGASAAKLITLLLNNPDKWTLYRDGLMNQI